MGRESMSFCDLLCLRSWIYIKKKYVFLNIKPIFATMRVIYLSECEQIIYVQSPKITTTT